MKVITVVGARPQFIKAAVVSSVLSGSIGVEEHILHTGQHYDSNMSEIFFSELGINPPRWNLDVRSASHGEQTAKMLVGIESVLVEEKPDWLLLYGDTNSTLAGALAAAKIGVPIAHVEAGLRSRNMAMPEEVNRILTDHVSSMLFAPSLNAVCNLQREGFSDQLIFFSGDVMFDAAINFGPSEFTEPGRFLAEIVGAGPYILATIHRQENTENSDGLDSIIAALSTLAEEITVIWPVHPRMRLKLEAHPIAAKSHIRFCEPLGYRDMQLLLKRATLVATDSGGVQKEAYFHRVPCVTLRTETEWTELVDLGWNVIVPPTSTDEIAEAIRRRIGTTGDMTATPFGDGTAGVKIATALGVRP